MWTVRLMQRHTRHDERNSMTENYREAAIRHFNDAELLKRSTRLDSAGHLIGFAAECAIKSALEAASPLSNEFRIHLPLLALAALKSIRSRKQSPLLNLLQSTRNGFFGDWKVSYRYFQDGHVSPEAYAKWKNLTERLFCAAGIRR